MERKRIRKEKQKELEKKKKELKNISKNKSQKSKKRYIPKKYALIIISIVILSIIIPILILFLTPTSASSWFVESDNIYYTFQNNDLNINFINCRYSMAVTGTMIDAGIKDNKFTFDIEDTNCTRTYSGSIISIGNSTTGNEQDYTITGIPEINFNEHRIRDGMMSYPSSVWWNHNLTNTDLDLYRTSHLYTYLKKPIFTSNIYPQSTNLTTTQNLSISLTIIGGANLTGFDKIDLLKISFSFKNQENVTFSNPLAFNSSLYTDKGEFTFYKIVYDVRANQEIKLKFNITINCKNNFTNLNLLNPLQDAQVVVQFKDKLIGFIYGNHLTSDEVQLEQLNAISKRAIEAWSNLRRDKYINLLILFPLIYNSTIYS
ncbi:MAG: hypothetical protein ACTSVK_17385 [Promethearchaeota archaeon]